VKVALPEYLVEAMDRTIERSAYPDRSAFVVDAVANLIAELEAQEPTAASRGRVGSLSRPPSAAPVWALSSPLAGRGSSTPELAEVTSTARPPVALAGPPLDVPTAREVCPAAREPLWGMHNRDWPTLWAASELGKDTLSGAVVFDEWVKRLLDRALRVASWLSDLEYDASGFPSVRRTSKRAESSARFQAFFVGIALGRGPLFDLRLAAPAGSDTVLLTAPGAQLLRDLAGLEPRRHTRVRDEWRHAFLTHLAVWVPADFAFLAEVVELLAQGVTSRDALIEAVAAAHPEWMKTSIVATNIAGFVARGREWNLIESRQKDRRYVLVPDAREALEDAATAAREHPGRDTGDHPVRETGEEDRL
jgi:Arc/MetJ-type ribon-helix-helix transcriptional regulator